MKYKVGDSVIIDSEDTYFSDVRNKIGKISMLNPRGCVVDFGNNRACYW